MRVSHECLALLIRQRSSSGCRKHSHEIFQIDVSALDIGAQAVAIMVVLGFSLIDISGGQATMALKLVVDQGRRHDSFFGSLVPWWIAA